jgi:hypothetical protein
MLTNGAGNCSCPAVAFEPFFFPLVRTVVTPHPRCGAAVALSFIGPKIHFMIPSSCTLCCGVLVDANSNAQSKRKSCRKGVPLPVTSLDHQPGKC